MVYRRPEMAVKAPRWYMAELVYRERIISRASCYLMSILAVVIGCEAYTGK